jgi:membrane-associated phospholipid phosphatase
MAKSTARRAAKSVTAAESRIAKAAARHRDNRAMEAVSKLSEVGDQPQLRTICGATIAAGLLTGRPRLTRAGVRMLFAHELATAIKSFIKHRVDRTRPRSAKTASQAKARLGDSRAKEESSFPSGHTAGAVTVARAFAHEFPEQGGPAQVAAAAIGLAQIPRCAHYPTDVGVGAIIGVAAEALVGVVMNGIAEGPGEAPRRAYRLPVHPPALAAEVGEGDGKGIAAVHR